MDFSLFFSVFSVPPKRDPWFGPALALGGGMKDSAIKRLFVQRVKEVGSVRAFVCLVFGHQYRRTVAILLVELKRMTRRTSYPLGGAWVQLAFRSHFAAVFREFAEQSTCVEESACPQQCVLQPGFRDAMLRVIAEEGPEDPATFFEKLRDVKMTLAGSRVFTSALQQRFFGHVWDPARQRRLVPLGLLPQSLLTLERLVESEEYAARDVALGMGRHRRLGVNSWLHCLDMELVTLIGTLANIDPRWHEV